LMIRLQVQFQHHWYHLRVTSLRSFQATPI
jgi:hypothetical protein